MKPVDGIWAEYWIICLGVFNYVTNISYFIARQIIRCGNKKKVSQFTKTKPFEEKKMQKTSSFLLQKKLLGSTYDLLNPLTLMKRELQNFREHKSARGFV